MKKREKTSKIIVDYIHKYGRATGKELADFLNISGRAVRKQLTGLLAEKRLAKQGRPPKVFYLLNDADIKDITDSSVIEKKERDIIKENFLLITALGEKKEGVEAFIAWCQDRNLPVEETSKKYAGLLKQYARYKKAGLIDGMHKMKHTFKKVYLDKVFYLDFYSIEIFGKTKLGQMLLYSKQSQNKKLIKGLVSEIKDKIKTFIKNQKINAIGFIPPTVKREVQFMKELEKNLKVALPVISLVKTQNEIMVAQKTLNKLADRVLNAEKTIFVADNRVFKNVLLIDDALGSGATLNEVAKKIKKQGLAKHVAGLAITGSFSGFEVISEV